MIYNYNKEKNVSYNSRCKNVREYYFRLTFTTFNHLLIQIN